MKTTKKTKLDYKLLTKVHDDLSKLASRIAWRLENLEDRKSHLEGVSDEAERKKLQEGIKKSESVLTNLRREYATVSGKLVVGQSEQLVCDLCNQSYTKEELKVWHCFNCGEQDL